MTAIERSDETRKYSGRNALIRRLERNNKCLIGLENNLNSYICEPKTRLLFERLTAIKISLMELKNAQRELIGGLKNKTIYIEESKSLISTQLESYNKLEIVILEYIGMSKMHGN